MQQKRLQQRRQRRHPDGGDTCGAPRGRLGQLESGATGGGPFPLGRARNAAAIAAKAAMAAFLVGASLSAAPVSASTVSASTVLPATVSAAPVSASTLLGQLSVAAPVLSGYDRSLFGNGWDDADHDGCDTRAEVLQVEATAPLTYSSGCTVATGQWTSAYDGVTWTAASDLDIDHMVPLAEAWASGASSWTPERRLAYANDLGYPGSLNAVTSRVNESKGDRDISQWLPPAPSDQCQYAVDWVAVKWRWDESVDDTEKAALTTLLGTGGCGDTPVDVAKADATPPPPPPTTDHLSAGQSLTAGTTLVSPGAAYSLVMQTDGNAVVYRAGGGSSFNTATSGNAGARLVMQTDGNLVLYSSAGGALWHNSAVGSGTVLRIQDDGNLVEYGPSAALWSSKGGLVRPPTPPPPPPPPVTGPTLGAGQTMRAGQQLTNGGYRLSLQSDGNLVNYASSGRVVWQSRTSGHAGATFTMQGDGNAVLYAGGRAWFTTGTVGNPGARLTLGADGNVVVYATTGSVLFRTGADPGPGGGGGVQTGIKPGAYCTPPGATGIAATGKRYLCAYYVTDGRYHWKPV